MVAQSKNCAGRAVYISVFKHKKTGTLNMAKAARTAWGIDVGNCKLKALKLTMEPEGVTVSDFAVIEHEKILSQPDVTAEKRTELVTKALSKFLDEHDIKGSALVVSVPGQNSFARFIKLPPVETKRIPEIVRYEAIQQIPFDIADVEWDWQSFKEEDSPDVHVGIFAIKRDLVNRALQPFAHLDCLINIVQMAPMALFNFFRYDQKVLQETAASEAVIILDIGADNTDLVIVDGGKIWQRNIPIGGNQFTAAVQKAFKLSFSKAEAIKRTASTSKYARQIFQAMRSVFADLAAEIQRSLGYYSSSNRNVKFSEVLALGNVMKLPGLIKFLQQSLSLPVKRLDNFESVKLSPEISVSEFAANIPSLGVAYGLALQALGLGEINSNLLPAEITRQTQMQRKRPWFIAACGLVALSAVLFLFSAWSQKSDIKTAEAQYIPIINRAEAAIRRNSSAKSDLESKISTAKTKIKECESYYEPRTLVPLLFQTVARDCTPNAQNNPDPVQRKLYAAFDAGNAQAVMNLLPRNLRQQVFITSVRIIPTDNLEQPFDEIVKTQTTRQGGGLPGGGVLPGMGMPGMEMPGMGMPGMGMPGIPGGGMPGGGMPGAAGVTPGKGKKVFGFAVVIEGSTPYKDGLKFLSPPEVGLDRSRWGYFDRLRHLGMSDKEIIQQANKSPKAAAAGSTPAYGVPAAPAKAASKKTRNGNHKLVAPNTPAQKQASAAAAKLPFEAYIGSGDPENYFDYSSGWVSGTPTPEQPVGLGILKQTKKASNIQGGGAGEVMPGMGMPGMEMPGMGMPGMGAPGIGMAGNKNTQPPLYIDPFTLEPVSTTYKTDQKGNIVFDPSGKPVPVHHDYWFRVKLKVKTKKQPKSASSGGAAGAGAGVPVY